MIRKLLVVLLSLLPTAVLYVVARRVGYTDGYIDAGLDRSRSALTDSLAWAEQEARRSRAGLTVMYLLLWACAIVGVIAVGLSITAATG